MLQALTKQLRLIVGRSLRETGQMLDIKGSKCMKDVAYQIRASRHRRIMPLDFMIPSYGQTFIAPNASLQGEVHLGNNCAVMYGANLKGNPSAIRIADNVLIGENSVLRVAHNLPKQLPKSTNINSNVLIENNCVISGATIDSNVWIGHGSVIGQGVRIEQNSIVLPGSTVQAGVQIPTGQVWGGQVAAYLRDVTPEDWKLFQEKLGKGLEQARQNQAFLSDMGIESQGNRKFY